MASASHLAFVFLVFFSTGVKSVTFNLKNHCSYTIWPATITGIDTPPINGFELQPQASKSFDAPPHWSGRVWPRLFCNTINGKFTCESGDCGTGQLSCNEQGGKPPATLIEFTLLSSNGSDFYDISLIDGFNLPVSVVPANSACTAVTCPVDIANMGCPDELLVRNSDGTKIVGCDSACNKYNTPEYCCTGVYSTRDKCKPTNYSEIFKRLCPQAYSYVFDDRTSLFACRGGSSGYTITFCP